MLAGYRSGKTIMYTIIARHIELLKDLVLGKVCSAPGRKEIAALRIQNASFRIA